MITILIDSQKDTSFLKAAYEGLTDNEVLVNPTRAKVEEVLKARPTERVMLMGHGSPSGLFTHDWRGYVIDAKNARLLKGREVIGIWCWAKKFAQMMGLKGFFTSMFISNLGEYRSFFPTTENKPTEEDIFNEITAFSKMVNFLIKTETPMNEWVGYLKNYENTDKDFVKFNYDALEYFEGRDVEIPTEEETSSSTSYTSTEASPLEEDIALDADANDSYYYFRNLYNTEDLLSLTLEEIIEFAYTEGYKAGRTEK